MRISTTIALLSVTLLELAAVEPAAVGSASEVTVRQGDSDGYRPALDAPVHAGTEVEVLECRGSWSQVRLPDGLSGWLPNHSLIIL